MVKSMLLLFHFFWIIKMCGYCWWKRIVVFRSSANRLIQFAPRSERRLWVYSLDAHRFIGFTNRELVCNFGVPRGVTQKRNTSTSGSKPSQNQFVRNKSNEYIYIHIDLYPAERVVYMRHIQLLFSTHPLHEMIGIVFTTTTTPPPPSTPLGRVAITRVSCCPVLWHCVRHASRVNGLLFSGAQHTARQTKPNKLLRGGPSTRTPTAVRTSREFRSRRMRKSGKPENNTLGYGVYYNIVFCIYYFFLFKLQQQS